MKKHNLSITPIQKGGKNISYTNETNEEISLIDEIDVESNSESKDTSDITINDTLSEMDDTSGTIIKEDNESKTDDISGLNINNLISKVPDISGITININNNYNMPDKNTDLKNISITQDTNNTEISGEETKICIGCSDEFITFSGNDKCPEMQK